MLIKIVEIAKLKGFQTLLLVKQCCVIHCNNCVTSFRITPIRMLQNGEWYKFGFFRFDRPAKILSWDIILRAV